MKTKQVLPDKILNAEVWTAAALILYKSLYTVCFPLQSLHTKLSAASKSTLVRRPLWNLWISNPGSQSEDTDGSRKNWTVSKYTPLKCSLIFKKISTITQLSILSYDFLIKMLLRISPNIKCIATLSCEMRNTGTILTQESSVAVSVLPRITSHYWNAETVWLACTIADHRVYRVEN